MKAEVGKRYRHYRNGEEYIILSIARNSGDLEEMIVYEGQYNSPEFGDKPLWVRPRISFEEEIEVDGVVTQRFLALD